MIHNLEATVFVYRHKQTMQILCEYLYKAQELEESPDWEHLATLEPRMWIQYHWDDRADEREACARIAEEWLGPTKDREIHIAQAIRGRGKA